MERRHFNHKREEIVNNGVKELVGHLTPWKVCDRFEFVVEIQLWAHENEAEGVNTTN